MKLKFKYEMTEEQAQTLKMAAFACGKRSLADYFSHCISSFTAYLGEQMAKQRADAAAQAEKEALDAILPSIDTPPEGAATAQSTEAK